MRSVSQGGDEEHRLSSYRLQLVRKQTEQHLELSGQDSASMDNSTLCIVLIHNQRNGGKDMAVLSKHHGA